MSELEYRIKANNRRQKEANQAFARRLFRHGIHYAAEHDKGKEWKDKERHTAAGNTSHDYSLWRCLSQQIVCVCVCARMHICFHSSFRSLVRFRSHPSIFTHSPFSCALSYRVLLLLSILLLGYVHRQGVRDALTCTGKCGCRIPRYTRCRRFSELCILQVI